MIEAFKEMLCTFGLHKWKIVEGTERYKDRYTEVADFICDRCGVEGEGTR